MTPTTWEELEAACLSCVPTQQVSCFLVQQLPTFLDSQLSTNNNNKPTILKMVLERALLRPMEALRPERSSASGSGTTTEPLNEDDHGFGAKIQLQVGLRLALWARFGTDFARMYQTTRIRKLASKKLKKRRRQESPRNYVLNDILSLLQLGAVRLPPQRLFGDFLKSCTLYPQWRSCMQEIQEIWNYFELPYPTTIQEEEPPASMQLSPPRKRKQRSPKENKEKVETTALKDEESSLGTGKMSLVAASSRRPNSLLGKTPRQRFVGSHFNTRLSNTSVLFRPVVVTAPKAAPPQSRRSTNKKNLSSKRFVPSTPATQKWDSKQQTQQPPVVAPETPRQNRMLPPTTVGRTSQTYKSDRNMLPPTPRTGETMKTKILETPCARTERKIMATPQSNRMLPPVSRTTTANKAIVPETPANMPPPPPPQQRRAVAVVQPRVANTTPTSSRISVVAQAMQAINQRRWRRQERIQE